MANSFDRNNSPLAPGDPVVIFGTVAQNPAAAPGQVCVNIPSTTGTGTTIAVDSAQVEGSHKGKGGSAPPGAPAGKPGSDKTPAANGNPARELAGAGSGK